jgi:hypothetical protein
MQCKTGDFALRLTDCPGNNKTERCSECNLIFKCKVQLLDCDCCLGRRYCPRKLVLDMQEFILYYFLVTGTGWLVRLPLYFSV